MKCYRIRNWSELFENNRSRVVKHAHWVAIPNRHDGENFSAIMAHPDGAMIYAAWILIVQVASKCQQRGTLMRDNGQPHTPETLSLKTRAPSKWFDTALAWLEENTDWLESSQLAETTQDDGSGVPRERQRDGSRLYIEGKEQKERNAAEFLALEACRVFNPKANHPPFAILTNCLDLLKAHSQEDILAVFDAVAEKRFEFAPTRPDTLTDPAKFDGWIAKSQQPQHRSDPNI